MPYTKANSKCLRDLNRRHDPIQLLDANTGKTFSDINCTNVFFGQSPKAKEIKAKINKWDKWSKKKKKKKRIYTQCSLPSNIC